MHNAGYVRHDGGIASHFLLDCLHAMGEIVRYIAIKGHTLLTKVVTFLS